LSVLVKVCVNTFEHAVRIEQTRWIAEIALAAYPCHDCARIYVRLERSPYGITPPLTRRRIVNNEPPLNDVPRVPVEPRLDEAGHVRPDIGWKGRIWDRLSGVQGKYDDPASKLSFEQNVQEPRRRHGITPHDFSWLTDGTTEVANAPAFGPSLKTITAIGMPLLLPRKPFTGWRFGPNA
jgi:hypothetical protein